MKESLLNYTPSELTDLMKSLDLPAYTGTQIAQWIYQKKVLAFQEMTNLKKEVRTLLEEKFHLNDLTLTKTQASQDGTTKYLMTCHDGASVETVMIPSLNSNRKTACISTQVGCNMGCRFCFTGTQKKLRDLTHGEVVAQVLHLFLSGHDITNVVFMGMGEPLDNHDVSLRACQTLISRDGFDLSHRRVTLSTSGLVPKLIQFLQNSTVNLAISLHAPTEELRREIMPISKAYSLESLLEACKEHFPKNKKRITFEYVLLKGVNDQEKHAKALIKVLHGLRAKINLIAFNPFPGSPYERSSDEAMAKFNDFCNQHGIMTTLRKSRGMDILAACGQLKATENR